MIPRLREEGPVFATRAEWARVRGNHAKTKTQKYENELREIPRRPTARSTVPARPASTDRRRAEAEQSWAVLRRKPRVVPRRPAQGAEGAQEHPRNARGSGLGYDLGPGGA